jgi:hypothetical protein
MKSLKIILSVIIGMIMTLLTASIIHTTGLSSEVSFGVALGGAITLTLINNKMPQGVAMSGVCGTIAANILKSCDNPVQAGTRDRGIIINFDDILSVTYAADGETIEGIVLNAGKVAYQIDGQNNSISPISRLVEQGFNNMFDHECTMKGFDVSPATKNQVNAMKDGRFVIICENYFRGASGNAAFEVYGITTGLETMEIERDPNSEETQGAFHFMFGTKKNKEPKTAATLYITDYAASKAIVDGLL